MSIVNTPENYKMTVFEDFYRNDAGRGDRFQILQVGFVALSLITEHLNKFLHIQKGKSLVFRYLLAITIMKKPLDNLLFCKIFSQIKIENNSKSGGTAGIVVALLY